MAEKSFLADLWSAFADDPPDNYSQQDLPDFTSVERELAAVAASPETAVPPSFASPELRNLPDFTRVERELASLADKGAAPAPHGAQKLGLDGLPDFLAVDRAQLEAVSVATATTPAKATLQRMPAKRPEPLFLGFADKRPAYWRLAEQPNAFLVVLGSSGFGKSVLLRVLGAELVDQELPLVCCDFHGDLKIPGLPHKTLGETLGLNPFLTGAELEESFLPLLDVCAPTLGHVQRRLLTTALEECKRAGEPTPKTLEARLISRLELASDRAPAQSLLHALRPFFASKVFAAPALDLERVIAEGASLNLSKVTRPEQLLVASAILSQVFLRLRRQGEVSQAGALRCVLVLDEAQILAESPFVAQLATEARKFGLGLLVATQELGQMSSSLLSNAASVAAFHVSYRAEARRFARLLSGIEPAELEKLERGECFFRDAQGIQRMQILGLEQRRRLTRGAD